MAGGIIETYYILFASDGPDVQSAAEAAKDSVERLRATLERTDKAAAGTGETFLDLSRRAAAFLAPLVGIGALAGTVTAFATSAQAAGTLADALETDIDVLQAWQGAAVRAGGEAADLAETFQSLSDVLAREQAGDGGLLADLGLAPGEIDITVGDIGSTGIRDASDLLLVLAERMEALDRSQARDLAEKFGVDTGTLALLMKGREAVEELLIRQRQLGLYTRQDADIAAGFNAALADMNQSFDAVSAVVARFLLPMFEAVANGLTDMAVSVLAHEDMIIGFFFGLTSILGALTISAAMAAAPFVLTVGAIVLLSAAFAVLYNDIQAFLAGHDSVIGQLSNDYPGLAALVHDVVGALETLWQIAGAVGRLLVQSIDDPRQAWETFKDTLDPILDGFSERFPELAQLVEDLGTIFLWLWETVGPVLANLGAFLTEYLIAVLEDVLSVAGTVFSVFAGGLNRVAGWIRDDTGEEPVAPRVPLGPRPDGIHPKFKTSLPPEVESQVFSGQQVLGLTSTPLSAGAGLTVAGGSRSSSTSVQVGSIEVHTRATEPDAVVSCIRDTLHQQLKSACQNFDDGVFA